MCIVDMARSRVMRFPSRYFLAKREAGFVSHEGFVISLFCCPIAALILAGAHRASVTWLAVIGWFLLLIGVLAFVSDIGMTFKHRRSQNHRKLESKKDDHVA